MTQPASYNSNYHVLGPFEGDGSTFTPYQRGERSPSSAPSSGNRSSPSGAAREKSYWVALLKRHMVPGDGGRLTLPQGPKGRFDYRGRVHVIHDLGFMQTEPPSGIEVDIESDQYLTLLITEVRHYGDGEDVTEERISFVPWDAIRSISFTRILSVEKRK